METLAQLEEALAAGAQLILLDNFGLDDLRRAVALAGRRAVLEASGGVTLENVRGIAETGVDRISACGLTKNVQALDLSMRFVDRVEPGPGSGVSGFLRSAAPPTRRL